MRKPFQQVYKGPYEVLKRHEKNYVLLIDGNKKIISIDRLKPAYIEVADIIHYDNKSIHFKKTPSIYDDNSFDPKIGNILPDTKRRVGTTLNKGIKKVHFNQ